MIYGIGTDIIEVERIRKALELDHGFREKIFSDEEIRYCESMKNKFQHYAARFSAKEAFMKALGTGWRDGIRFIEIEVVHDTLGKPLLNLTGKAKEMAEKAGLGDVHLTLSHVKDSASAVVVAEKITG